MTLLCVSLRLGLGLSRKQLLIALVAAINPFTPVAVAAVAAGLGCCCWAADAAAAGQLLLLLLQLLLLCHDSLLLITGSYSFIHNPKFSPSSNPNPQPNLTF